MVVPFSPGGDGLPSTEEREFLKDCLATAYRDRDADEDWVGANRGPEAFDWATATDHGAVAPPAAARFDDHDDPFPLLDDPFPLLADAVLSLIDPGPQDDDTEAILDIGIAADRAGRLRTRSLRVLAGLGQEEDPDPLEPTLGIAALAGVDPATLNDSQALDYQTAAGKMMSWLAARQFRAAAVFAAARPPVPSEAASAPQRVHSDISK
jgi:hypothetical protein